MAIDDDEWDRAAAAYEARYNVPRLSDIGKPQNLGNGSLARQLRDYRLTTAEILYHLPDQPNLLQTYVWQDYDIAPKFPVLLQFLDFWREKIEGSLHSVRVAAAGLVRPADWRSIGHLKYH